MEDQFSRTRLLIGEDGVERLKKARVAVFGIGGVGGYAVEALVRSGVGTIDLIDDDKVCLSNLNRQIIATRKTLGMYKVDVAKERVLDINPDAVVYKHKVFFMPETAYLFDFSQYDYVVDAIDTVTGKIELVMQADKADVPIISSMGAGNKLDASKLEVADIFDTSVCPLARVMRRELKNRGIKKLKVVYSKEPALTPREDPGKTFIERDDKGETESGSVIRKQIPGSTAFVPSVSGLIIAGEVVKDICAAADKKIQQEER